jgi:PPOX class probable F420-dependent enzyme
VYRRPVNDLNDLVSDAGLELLRSAAVATVVTLNEDGSPQASVAWLDVEDGEIVFATLSDQRKLRNLRRDARVTLVVHGPRINEWGLQEYLVIEGRARITPGGAAAMLQRLARVYLGPDVIFPRMPDPPPGFITRISVDKVKGVGPWQRSA